MVWFRVDDRFHGSDPVKRIPRADRAAAIGLWTLAGTWSSQFLKDGFVPAHMVEDFGSSIEHAQLLVQVGLWKVKKDGFQFVDWDKWQPTRENVELKRKATADRVAAHRAKKAENTGDGNAPVTRYNSVSNAPVRASRPDPTRPDHKEAKASLKPHPIPDDWEPTQEHEAKARELRVDLAREAEAFRLHAQSVDRRAVRWNAAFSMWLTKARPSQPKPAVDWMNR